jgi:hypothetical protein
MTRHVDRVVRIVIVCFVDGLLQSVGCIRDFRAVTEVDLQLLRTLKVSLAATAKRLLQEPVNFQLLSFKLRFLFADRRPLFGEQRGLLLKHGVVVPKGIRVLLKSGRVLQCISLQSSVFLFEKFQLRHAGQGNYVSKMRKINV